jgi:hypothetical protein
MALNTMVNISNIPLIVVDEKSFDSFFYNKACEAGSAPGLELEKHECITISS